MTELPVIPKKWNVSILTSNIGDASLCIALSINKYVIPKNLFKKGEFPTIYSTSIFFKLLFRPP